MSETTFNQIRSMPENMQLKFFVAVCDYGLNGNEPEFNGMENSVWIPMKDLIDYSSERRNINSENGKKGGAPVGNNNRAKAKSTEKNKNLPNAANVKKEAAIHKFFIDLKKAAEILESGLDPLWLLGPNSFLELAAERVEERYGDKDKPDSEKKDIFISAVKKWDDLREEYPEWKKRKEEKDKVIKKNMEIKNAYEKHPVICECGNDLHEFNREFRCDGCNKIYTLNEKSLKWELR
jgi:hypothetical protein